MFFLISMEVQGEGRWQAGEVRSRGCVGVRGAGVGGSLV